jgi:putative ABC transport system permease protein
MSQAALLGAIEIGLVYALVAFGVYLSFRILDFPDLTVDGSFPLGAAVAGTLITGGTDPVTATAAAILAGGCAGLVTAWLNLRFGILHLLASILTMIALFSVVLRIMGRPNLALLNQETIVTLFAWTGIDRPVLRPLLMLAIVLVVWALLARFLSSEFGLAMRATGANRRMARAQGIPTGLYVYTGMALSNGLVGLSGALFAQTAGFADVTSGTGTIVVGLAAVILGETLIRTRSVWLAILACILGSILYRIAIGLALNSDLLGLQASDLKLVTAVLVGFALVLPRLGGSLGRIGTGRAP